MMYLNKLLKLFSIIFTDFLCIINIHDYKYLEQKVKAFDYFGKELSHTMNVRICRRCKKRQALFSGPYGDRYETIN